MCSVVCFAGGFTMYHCISFDAVEIYCLKETEIYTDRVLSIGFCPLCNKPVAELVEQNFMGGINKTTAVGINAQNMMLALKNDIVRAVPKHIKQKRRFKPFGWKYGENKECNNGKVRQYACDFYGNKELIKEI